MIKHNMKRLDYGGIIVSSLMILLGIVLYYFILDNPFKGYSIICIASGLGGLTGLLKNIILKYLLLVLLILITILSIFIE